MAITEAKALAALPSEGWLRDYVEFASTAVDCNLSYHIACGLAILSQFCPKGLGIPFGADVRYGTLFGLIIGPSTNSRKGGSVTLARRVLSAADPDSLREEINSREALVQALKFSPRMLLTYPEFGDFLARSQDSHLSTVKTTLNNCFDNVPIGSVTVSELRAKGKNSKPLKDPRLSLLCAVDPNYLERFTERVDWTSGFFARFFCIYGHRERSFSWPEPNLKRVEDLAKRLRELRTWEQKCFEDEATVGQCVGRTVAARKMWEEWDKEIENWRKQLKPSLAPMLGRVAEYSSRIALLLALDCEDVSENWQLDVNTLEPAIRIARLHADSVLEIGESIAPSVSMRERNIVLSAIKSSYDSEDGAPLTKIIRHAEMPKRKIDEWLHHLNAEGVCHRTSTHVTLDIEFLARIGGINYEGEEGMGGSGVGDGEMAGATAKDEWDVLH